MPEIWSMLRCMLSDSCSARPETSSRHPPRWGKPRNLSQRQKCPSCGDFCRFKSRSRLMLRSRRSPQASGLCDRIQSYRNGSRACAAWKSHPVRSPVTRSLPTDALIPAFFATSSRRLVKSSYPMESRTALLTAFYRQIRPCNQAGMSDFGELLVNIPDESFRCVD
jgi:hypothetical protein